MNQLGTKLSSLNSPKTARSTKLLVLIKSHDNSPDWFNRTDWLRWGLEMIYRHVIGLSRGRDNPSRLQWRQCDNRHEPEEIAR